MAEGDDAADGSAVNYDFADCTVQNHFWHRAGRRTSDGGAVTITYECLTCHKRKHVTYSVQGLFIINRRYENPPGYKLPAKDDRITRSEWREIYLTRLLKRRKR